ncbi:uncharacterized protein BX664DRAFT_335750 [Halteromyces radiatus]|uniref:uncharacterized protein n=1 Tax=Halteromyces radiatus TaxID=101107 RepID=UPI00221F533A|nr:uncharacterized protein BX664DRAFT_335750 [Halteromyces radiatus]KAI8086419.1 hypothetical protein BX664DRAFT_335750 [Halteromyces radiatus]
MTSRLPILFNTTVKRGLRETARVTHQQQHRVIRRSYITHQEQRTGSNTTPLLIGGLLALSGLVFYSRHEAALSGEKQHIDPSDIKGKEIQQDKELEEKVQQTDYPIQPSDHPFVTKKAGYVDPADITRQDPSKPGTIKEGVQYTENLIAGKVDLAHQVATDKIQSVEEKIDEANWDIFPGKTEELKGSWDSTKKTLQDSWDRFSNNISRELTSLQGELDSARQQLQDKMNEAKEKGRAGVEHISDEASKRSQQAYEDLDAISTQWIKDADRVRKQTQDYWDTFTKDVSDNAQRTQKILDDQAKQLAQDIEAVRSRAGATTQQIEDQIKSLKQQAEQQSQEIKDKSQAEWTKLYNGASDKVKNAQAELQDAHQQARKKAQDIVNSWK